MYAPKLAGSAIQKLYSGFSTAHERYHVVFPDVVQHRQGAALDKPRVSGGALLLRRLGLKPKLELRRELGCDLGNRTLAAELIHNRDGEWRTTIPRLYEVLGSVVQAHGTERGS